jgi:hypothetical protein
VSLRAKPGLPLEVATILADALNRALQGQQPAITREQAWRCLEEAGRRGVPASIVFDQKQYFSHGTLFALHGVHVLVIDELRICVVDRIVKRMENKIFGFEREPDLA